MLEVSQQARGGGEDRPNSPDFLSRAFKKKKKEKKKTQNTKARVANILIVNEKLQTLEATLVVREEKYF